MIYWLAKWLEGLSPSLDYFRVLRYISVRAALALIVAFVISVLIAPSIIRLLKRLNLGDVIRKIEKPNCPDLYEMHKAKEGTPSMGGLIILGALLTSVLLFTRFTHPLVITVIGVALSLGMLGFVDDYQKVVKKKRRGLSPRLKLCIQIIIGLGFGLYMYSVDLGIFYALKGMRGNTYLCFPFFKSLYPALGILFIPYAMMVLTATANAVNLTDGLDGLAIGVTIVVSLCFGIIAYLVGRVDFAPYLILPYVPGAAELTIVLAGTVGAGLGFLWFNSHPAEVFMGDTGSQALGGIIGSSALLIKQEFLLLVIGGIFVIELISVVIQVFSYQTTGRRVFLMTPLHHHFERKGWAESKIICRFWIITGLLALIGSSSLKLR
ncbi:phospho-N-acetylmuramoyl-pentapeptide-transferase [Candidatus Sumerlaeota bacterium]|nr:phospho-N-acetylmuramoyl-pentapeptide-transferase [Candidatus Sumerlaeota bacterium]